MRKIFVGFTLAEVLITLGVIGVVAAITMPTLVQHYQEHVTVNKVKKLHSLFAQALQMSINENGYINEWGLSDSTTEEDAIKLAEKIKPYLKIIKDCGTQSTDCIDYNGISKRLDGKDGANYNDSIYYKFILSDGSYVIIRNTEFTTDISGRYGIILTDINGSKAPNTIGKDIFQIGHIRSHGLVPPAQDDCYLNNSGYGCARHILTYGNMNYPKEKTAE